MRIGHKSHTEGAQPVESRSVPRGKLKLPIPGLTLSRSSLRLPRRYGGETLVYLVHEGTPVRFLCTLDEHLGTRYRMRLAKQTKHARNVAAAGLAVPTWLFP